MNPTNEIKKKQSRKGTGKINKQIASAPPPTRIDCDGAAHGLEHPGLGSEAPILAPTDHESELKYLISPVFGEGWVAALPANFNFPRNQNACACSQTPKAAKTNGPGK